jgi:NAD(P)-dependent dehydrogenase (short-subunit alcohol dehydrogenase family)
MSENIGMSSNMLEGKVIIVTGAGAGIGEHISKLAAAQGARVVVNDIAVARDGNDRPANRVVEEIRAAGGHAVANYDSVATWKSAHAIVETAVEHYGRLDGVVNNAGLVRDKIFHRMSEEEWEAVIAVNLSGPFFVSRAASVIFKEQQAGAFVHMSSTSGLIGNYAQVNYGAAKMGVAGLSKCIALDMSRFNVRSNAIAPFAFTQMTDTIPADNEENIRRREALKLMTPEKIAPLAVALLSDAAADITGQIFAVRKNEMVLFSQPRPIRTAQVAGGWTPQLCVDTALPAFRNSMHKLERSSEVFTWDPF